MAEKIIGKNKKEILSCRKSWNKKRDNIHSIQSSMNLHPLWVTLYYGEVICLFFM